MVSVLVLAMFIFTGMTAFGAPSEDYTWIYEDFEDRAAMLAGTPYNNGTLTYVSGGAGGSKGAGKVTVIQDLGAIRYNTALKNGQTYRLSAMIKMADASKVPAEALSYVQFIFYHTQVGGTAKGYNIVKASGANHSSEEWVRFETEYTFNGTATISGAAAAVEDDCTLELRIGTGRLNMFTDTSGYEYFIDDLIVEPVVVVNEPSNENLFTGGNFEDSSLDSNWQTLNNATYELKTDGGANGTSGYAAITIPQSTSIARLQRKAVPISFNRAYKVSFWHKAGDAAAVGQNIGLYLQWYDATTSPATNILWQAPSVGTLANEWQKAEVTVFQDGVTDITVLPVLSFRAPDGKTALTYCIDEIEVVLLNPGEYIYMGDFSGTTEEVEAVWVNNATKESVELTEDLPEGCSGKSVKVTELGDYPQFGQGVYVERGKTYTLSFWAKLDGLTASGSETAETVAMKTYLDRNVSGTTYTGGEQYVWLEEKTLTKDWQKFEYTFTCDTETQPESGYRYPMIKFRMGDGKQRAVYYMADMSMVCASEQVEAVLKINNLNVSGDLLTGETLTVSGQFSGGTEGASFFRTLRSENKANWVTVKSEIISGGNYTYDITEEDKGSYLRFEVLPINSAGAAGPVAAYETAAKVAGMFDVNIALGAWKVDTAELSAAVSVGNNGGVQRNVLVILALYDANHTMVDVNSAYKQVAAGTQAQIPVQIAVNAEAEEARVFVWEGTSLSDTDCMPYTKYVKIIKEF